MMGPSVLNLRIAVSIRRDGRRHPGTAVDPCNFAFTGDSTDAGAALATLAPEQVGMLHFKQRRAGKLDVTVGEGGEVDWPRLVPLIVARRLFRQGLFEMASDLRLWEHLERSSEYLHRLWRQTGTDEPLGG